MICISIAQESRRFALADMLNASRQCDLLEVRLDRFGKAPDLAELLAAKPRPVIFSCRRPQDGGDWQGTEDERLALLRQCIISKADYVEIELDAADQIRKFPPTKRVISYTNFQETPSDIADIYAQACSKSPDVVKLTTLARTPEEAWPLVQLLARPPVPTVVVGLGKPGVMLTILGRKIGAPWTYAALEKGMESYPGQPTVHDLREVYHYDAVGRSTPLLGVAGFGELEYLTAGALNATLAGLGSGMRCLPLQIGNVRLFRRVVEVVKLAGVAVDEEHRGPIVSIANDLDPAAQQAQAADLLVQKQKSLRGCNVLGEAAVAALEGSAGGPGGRSWKGRPVMIVGANAAARSVAYAVKGRGAVPIIAARDRAAALELAQALECRAIPFEALYSTMHDVLVVCSEEKMPIAARGRAGEPSVHAGYLKPDMTVMDLTALPRKSTLLRAAEAPGCHVIAPRDFLAWHLALQLGVLLGKPVPPEPLAEAMRGVVEDEE